MSTKKLDIDMMSKPQLVELAKKIGLPSTGSKSELITRLNEHKESHPDDDVKDGEHSEEESEPDVSQDVDVGAQARAQAIKEKLSLIDRQRSLRDKEFRVKQELERLEEERRGIQEEMKQNELADELQAIESGNYVPPLKQQSYKSPNANSNKVGSDTLFSQPKDTFDNPVVYMQQQMLDLMSLPKPRLIEFNGDPLEYHVFLSLFDSCIHNANINDASKLNRLFDLCKGKALSVIMPCALMHPAEGYQRARQLLSSRFGDDFLIAESYVSKITSGAQIKINNVTALQEFTDQVRGCAETLAAMGRTGEIDSRVRLVKLVSRLPYKLQERWRTQAVAAREKTGDYPDIGKFVSFLDRATKELSDPVFGFIESKDTRQKSSYKSNFTGNVSTSGGKQSRPGCVVCSGDHPVYLCDSFKRASPTERVKIAKENKLCFNCLRGSKHSYQDCKSERVCNTNGCKLKHSYLLHEALTGSQKQRGGTTAVPSSNGASSTKRETETTTIEVPTAESETTCAASCNLQGKGKTALPIVEVCIQAHDENQATTVKTFALLDPGSTRSFCSEELMTSLKVAGEKTTMTVTTLNGGKQITAPSIHLSVASSQPKSNKRKYLDVSGVCAVKEFPSLISSVVSKADVQKFDHLRDLPFPNYVRDDVQLLIGQDNPMTFIPLEVRRGADTEPYAVRTPLGWAMNGKVNSQRQDTGVCSFIEAVSHVSCDDKLEERVERFWQLDKVPSCTDEDQSLSVNDKKVIDMWDETATVNEDGRYVLEIPFKEDVPNLQDNRPQAEKRLQHLGRRLSKDDALLKRYAAEINKLKENKYVEKVSEDTSKPGATWYIPHHSVFNVNKPDKLRVVFDCSAVYKDMSLNKSIHQGPDLANQLVGVLLRFREKRYGVMADVEAMFHQVVVPEKNRDALRFLWWKDDDTNQPTEIYRMTRHLFGGIWSSSVANYALQKAATDQESEFPPEVINAVLKSFYVDDLLRSEDTVTDAISTSKQVKTLLARRGFNLTKWMSNSREILESFDDSSRAKSVQNLDIKHSSLPNESALGMEWVTEDDVFRVRVKPRDAVLTRRGLLSYICSVYDPFGLVCPFVLIAKKVFQQETILKKGWDEALEDTSIHEFQRWLHNLDELKQIKIPRCFIPAGVGGSYEIEIHHFADASIQAYGTVTYLRILYGKEIKCQFIYGKSRLAPLKLNLSIPRLELLAAVIAVYVNRMLKRELTVDIKRTYFWSDSTTVLGYINSESRRFKTFVANRVAKIHAQSDPKQWRYVNTAENPADDASRGILPASFNKRWLCGPSFLYQDESEWPGRLEGNNVDNNDPEVKGEEVCNEMIVQHDYLIEMFSRYSSWYKLQKAVAWLKRYVMWLRNKKRKYNEALTATELEAASKQIIKHTQLAYFSEEINYLKHDSFVPRSSGLYKLDVFLDDEGLIHVGGRLNEANIDERSKTQVLVPRKSYVAVLIVRDTHQALRHAGTEQVLSECRQRYWIPAGRQVIRKEIHGCVTCKRFYSRPRPQRMANLPADRVAADEPPFTNVGVDCFGPFLVKRGRGTEKRYGCIFTCLVIRAVHIEILESLDADSFINSVIRFMSRRGKPRTIRCDNGTNFTAASKELTKSADDWNRRVHVNLRQKKIEWQFNPPFASHMGGAWERLIRSVRRVLKVIINSTLNGDEQLATVMCEIESILNNRPLTKNAESASDAPPLTPNQLLLGHETSTLPPGYFTVADVHNRRWRHSQFIADRFWRRWLKEYLHVIQHRQKWLQPTRDIKIGDIVLLVDELAPRNQWPIARVTSVSVGRDHHVRSATVQTSKSLLRRPVTKLCLLEAEH